MNIVSAMLGPATLSHQSVWASGTLMTQLASARPGLQDDEERERKKLRSSGWLVYIHIFPFEVHGSNRVLLNKQLQDVDRNGGVLLAQHERRRKLCTTHLNEVCTSDTAWITFVPKDITSFCLLPAGLEMIVLILAVLFCFGNELSCISSSGLACAQVFLSAFGLFVLVCMVRDEKLQQAEGKRCLLKLEPCCGASFRMQS
ncbi:hypothetical protein SRHO_G00317950 [Serrasalmus rhombeus]